MLNNFPVHPSSVCQDMSAQQVAWLPSAEEQQKQTIHCRTLGLYSDVALAIRIECQSFGANLFNIYKRFSEIFEEKIGPILGSLRHSAPCIRGLRQPQFSHY